MNTPTLVDGVIVPLVTPMATPGKPAAECATALLQTLAATGVRGILLFGSNGEGPMLPTDLLGEFAADVATQWRSMLSDGVVLVNVTGAATDEALRRAEAVSAANPDALALSSPLYFAHREDEITAHYREFAGLGVPVVAYNVPRYTGNPITLDVFRELVTMPHVVGVKDSSGDWTHFEQMLLIAKERADFGVSQGDEETLVRALRIGAHGITPGFGNIAPLLAVRIVNSVRDGATEEANHLQAIANGLGGIHSIRRGPPTVKAILDMFGVCPPHASAPFMACNKAERDLIRAHLVDYTEFLVPQARQGAVI